jgi:hypothetical protein
MHDSPRQLASTVQVLKALCRPLLQAAAVLLVTECPVRMPAGRHKYVFCTAKAGTGLEPITTDMA